MAHAWLAQHGIQVEQVSRNPSTAVLYEQALRYEEGSAIVDSGALVALSGAKTGRSPGDKRVVEHNDSKGDIWWGDINIPIDEHVFRINRERAIDYLNTRKRLFVVDAFAGWDPATRLKVRIICSRAYHALFMRNMLIRPTEEELANFGDPDFVVYNAGQFPANRYTSSMTSPTSVDLSFERHEMVILGTEYAGEMKKGVFTVMNYLMPKRGILSMHCSATEGEDGQSSILFGLSGTGKTTLSADPKRKLIGDDEHGWSDTGIFNVEGGCYAKVNNLSEAQEPDIYRALRFGAVLENVVYDTESRKVDFDDLSITQNTRGSYAIETIPNAKLPCVTGHPSQVIFLTADAFGVLPPVSRLNSAQAMYHFISGYTAKVAGTEMGVSDPEATFSACFGAPFMVWHPGVYAKLLAEKLERHGASTWLVNTGWSGGSYGTGSRMKLAYTRAIIDAIHDGSLAKSGFETEPFFGLEIPTSCPGVPSELLNPKGTWQEPTAYDRVAKQLAERFHANFTQFAEGVSEEVRQAGPKV